MRILTVTQAASYLRELIETDIILGDVWISGEVSGPRTQPSGHTYFTLKDAGAQLRAVMFRSALMRQRKMAEHLAQGSQVIAHGRLSVYEARGELQVVVDFVQPDGVGLRHAQFERLRAQLEEEGLFDESRKRQLPRVPRRIGVVTSPSGAVFHDICNVLTRRWPLAEVVLAPTPVQGPDAVHGVVAGIEQLNLQGDIDVIIVARGGGSIDELWAFNEEPVARAVFGSLVPVVSAIGHETDFTICDYVADLRAPTPSAAAELVAPDGMAVRSWIANRLEAVGNTMVRRMTRERDLVSALMNRAERGSIDLNRQRQRIDDFERRALHAVRSGYRDRVAAVHRCNGQLDALNPNATLSRGYAVVHKAGSVISSITDVSTGDALVIKVADGGFAARAEGGATRRRARQQLAVPNGRNGNKAAKNGNGEHAIQPVLFPN
ncbi:MAG: exodeoxyribonuclease VII large subunit [Dehalococcoidia bacterium]